MSDRLYHGTSAAAAAEIIFANSFMAEDTHGDGRGLGPSLSRNWKIAVRFADNASNNARVEGAEDWSPGYAEHLVDGTDGVILIFDRAKIGKMLTPITPSGREYGYEIDGQPISNEEEERMLAKADLDHIPNARRYIARIHPLNPNKFTAFCQKLVEIDPTYRTTVRHLLKLTQ